MDQHQPTTWEKVVPSGFSRDALLSQALMTLSLDDRNKIEEEIHGVRCGALEETPELINKALLEFDLQVNDIKAKNPALRVLRNVIRISASSSTDSGSCYLNDPDTRLIFLRCESFVVDKAIQKFLLFLEVASELFGDFVAERPMRRSDFTAEENKALKRSRAQFLPFRDRSGRRVFVTAGNSNYHLKESLTSKIVIYVHWLAAKDIETQRRGIVWHTLPFDEPPEWIWERDLNSTRTIKGRDDFKKAIRCIPIRVVANNTYFRDTPYSRFMSILYTFNIAPERRASTRLHFGELTENLYKMASFGLPVDVVPVTASGSIKCTNHAAWLDAMETLEDPNQTIFGDREPVDCPLVGDVVFRTGATPKYNPGNAYYREVVQSYGQEYFLEDKKKRRQIAKLIYDDIVENHNGRFLEWHNKGKVWLVIQSPEVAYQKIAKALNNHKYNTAKRASPTENTEKSYGRPVTPPQTALQEYYSKVHPSKRLKTSGCGYCTESSESSDDKNSCFGMDFFPL